MSRFVLRILFWCFAGGLKYLRPPQARGFDINFLQAHLELPIISVVKRKAHVVLQRQLGFCDRNFRRERPFIGVAADTPPGPVAFLREQGYIVDTSQQAADCAMYLGPTELADVRNQIQLLDLIETSSAPLVRFWRWPAGARSAFCVTGDLDALSLTDYAARVLAL